jgi:GT2 family glycosyltransferase
VTAELDVVIATRERPALLAACIESLGRQTLDRFQLTIVDDGSRNPVAETMSPDIAALPSVRVLRNESAEGPGASRNRGVAAGHAPYVLFLDDDVTAHPGLLAGHRGVFARHPGAVVSVGALLPPTGVRLPPWELWQADRLAREQMRLARGEATVSWSHVYTGNLAVRRADFEAVGGFDTAFARQEDVELGYRLFRHGCSFAFEPDALVWHHARHSLADWLRIPVASAQYDVMIDRLRPGSGHLEAIRRGMGERHWALRAARRVVGRPGTARAAERLAVAAAAALHRVGADRLAMLAFSLVWDIEYNRALAEATAPGPLEL